MVRPPSRTFKLDIYVEKLKVCCAEILLIAGDDRVLPVSGDVYEAGAIP